MNCDKCGEDKRFYRSYDGIVTPVPPEAHHCDVVRINNYKVSRLSFSERFWRVAKAARETPSDHDQQTWAAMVKQGRDDPPPTSPSGYAYVVYSEK